MTAAPESSVIAGRFGTATVGVPPPQLEAPRAGSCPRRRRWPWIAAAVILVLALLGGAYLLGHTLGGRGQVKVWQLRHDVPTGGAVGPADLVPVKVSKAAARSAVRTDAALPGTVAKRALRAGQLLPNDLLRQGTPLPGNGRVLLGIAASPGAIPDGLAAGDAVTVWSFRSRRRPARSSRTSMPPRRCCCRTSRSTPSSRQAPAASRR